MTKEKFKQAQIKLIRKSPFWACLTLESSYEFTNLVPTMAVDGEKFYINPEFVEKLSVEQLEGVIAHEILHLALLHILRGIGKDKFAWNVACDLAVNSILLSENFQLPSPLLPKMFDLENNKSAEYYYEKLREKNFQDDSIKSFDEHIYPQQRGQQSKQSQQDSQNDSQSQSDNQQNNQNASQSQSASQERQTHQKQTHQSSQSSQTSQTHQSSQSQEQTSSQSQSSQTHQKQTHQSSQTHQNKSKKSQKKTHQSQTHQSSQSQEQTHQNQNLNNSQNQKEKSESVFDKEISERIKELEEKWKRILSRAVNAQRSKGKLPGWFEEIVEKILEPKLDWKMLLRRYLNGFVVSKADWRRFDRRYVVHKIYLPQRRQKKLELVVAIDTSGSISSEMIKYFLTEIDEIVRVCDKYKVILIQCDVRITKNDEISSPLTLADIEPKIKGRRGTDFRPVFEYMKENSLTHLPLIYFTDLDGDFPADDGGIKTIWVVLEKDKDKKVPFGEIVVIKEV